MKKTSEKNGCLDGVPVKARRPSSAIRLTPRSNQQIQQAIENAGGMVPYALYNRFFHGLSPAEVKAYLQKNCNLTATDVQILRADTAYKIVNIIKENNMVPYWVYARYFSQLSPMEVRVWLGKHGLPVETKLQLRSTEIFIVIRKGTKIYHVPMEVRLKDNNKLGLWGGACAPGESYLECAIRELHEELGIKVKPCQLQVIEDNIHDHVYANGQVVEFHTRRYLLVLDHIPDFVINKSETFGLIYITEVNDEIHLYHQLDFIKRMMRQHVSCPSLPDE